MDSELKIMFLFCPQMNAGQHRVSNQILSVFIRVVCEQFFFCITITSMPKFVCLNNYPKFDLKVSRRVLIFRAKQKSRCRSKGFTEIRFDNAARCRER